MGTHQRGPHAPPPAGDDMPPGWYPEAHDGSLWRWWDGTRWSAHTWDVGVPRPSDEDRPDATD